MICTVEWQWGLANLRRTLLSVKKPVSMGAVRHMHGLIDEHQLRDLCLTVDLMKRNFERSMRYEHFDPSVCCKNASKHRNAS